MVASFERPAALDGQKRLRFFDDAKQTFIPPRVATEGAGVLFRDVKTDGAEPGIALQFDYCRRQRFGLTLGLAEQEKGQPGCRLVADSRKLGQFCDQTCERRDGV
jgi:hypothetical protein